MKHGQLGEVEGKLAADRSCAIVHLATQREVIVGLDFRGKWEVFAALSARPKISVRMRLRASGLKYFQREAISQFGPNRGQVRLLPSLKGQFDGPNAAAQAGLSVFNTIWKIPVDDWLWVTVAEFDDRPEPVPPNRWPSVG